MICFTHYVNRPAWEYADQDWRGHFTSDPARIGRATFHTWVVPVEWGFEPEVELAGWWWYAERVYHHHKLDEQWALTVVYRRGRKARAARKRARCTKYS